MRKTIPNLLLVSVLLIASQACTSLGVTTPDPNFINTAIAQTFAAALTQTAQAGIPITGQESPTPTMTRAASPTPFPTFTPVVIGVPQIRVSVNTNCRTGPGEVYGRVGALLVGEVAEVVGRSADGNYWVIRNPDRPGETCWIWGEHATLTGIAGILPVFTPPPTPTPTRTRTPLPTPTRTLTPSRTPTSTFTPTPTSSPTSTPTPGFAASYIGMESCTGTGWWVDIQLQNTGGITFEFISMTVEDTTTSNVLSLDSHDFTNRNGCTESDTQADLPLGATHLVSSAVFTEDLTGHELHATITLCSDPEQSGTCAAQAIDFTP